MALHKLNVAQEIGGKGIKVFLDDMQIHGVTKLDLNLELFEVPTVTMKISLREVAAGLEGVKLTEGRGENGITTI